MINVLNQKDITILELLLQNTNKYLTSQKIGSHLGVSDKTARKYIKQLNESIDNDLAQIKSVSGHGYYLEIIKEKEFKDKHRESVSKHHVTEGTNCIEEPRDRQHHILHRLFFTNDLIYLEDFSNELYVSDSTLMNDITEINKKLKSYALVLKTSQKSGVSILGDEQSKRHFIMDYFLINRYQENLKSFQEISSILPDIRLEEILLIVLEEYRNANLILNDTIIFNIVIHIALALKRVEVGHQIQSNMNIDKLTDIEELQTAKNIIDRLRISTGILLPDEEIYNIALHLKNKQSNKKFLRSQNIEESDLYDEIINVLKMLEQKTAINYSEDKILTDGLMSHFTPFLVRLNNKGEIKNPLLEEIKEKHKTQFMQTKEIFSTMEILKNKEVSDDEWAYIALHIIAAHERQMNKKRLNTLVICATGVGSSQMLKIRLENELGTKLVIDDVISYFEITDEKLKGIDLIVSSIDLSNFVFNIPIVNVSVLLNEDDVKEINQQISSDNNNYKDNKIENTEKSIKTNNIIKEYFDPDLFLHSYNIMTREEAIDALINQSYQVDNSINKIFFKDQLRLREEFSSVAFARDVAVPHPIEGISNEAKVAVLITPQGIEWDENSDNIRLTLLMIPDRFGEHHLEQVSWAILPILEDQESIDKLVGATNYNNFAEKLNHLLN